MLSRTASHLYWLARYMERADNLARLLDVSARLTLLPRSAAHEGLTAILGVSGASSAYWSTRSTLNADALLNFMIGDVTNSSSIYHCLQSARQNAHAVRGHITSETWEAINTTWLELQNWTDSGVTMRNAPEFFDWIKQRTHIYRGALYGTVLRDDGFRFMRIGTCLELADNTLRLLDTKYQMIDLAPDAPKDDATIRADYLWQTLLQALGAREAYTQIYSYILEASNVIDLLVLRDDVPRSLLACLDELVQALAELEGPNGKPAKRLAGEFYSRVRYGDLDEIFTQGPHTWLTEAIDDVATLASRVQTAYLEVA
ncbi:alpha-E domain-containing protein [Phytohalomonas tamaricis]|uniref:alpha-E domain-containing protein n=1 Tax=Phytohalomonas tamaricis TaxID=2081032 RepID=UPI000D0B169B|nr:alpha-E domain-containing protein [Phytohalomonas tamaricis]